MTREKRKTPLRRADTANLDDEQYRALTTGRPYFGNPFVDTAEMRAAWQANRSDLLREWITKRPGSRPFAWWLFEAVPRYGERKVVSEVWCEEYRPGWLQYGILHTNTTPANQESEAEYLQRHGLLQADEATAFYPCEYC